MMRWVIEVNTNEGIRGYIARRDGARIAEVNGVGISETIGHALKFEDEEAAEEHLEILETEHDFDRDFALIRCIAHDSLFELRLGKDPDVDSLSVVKEDGRWFLFVWDSGAGRVVEELDQHAAEMLIDVLEKFDLKLRRLESEARRHG